LANLYSYVGGDSINRIDPTGLTVFGFGVSAEGQILVGGQLSIHVVVDDKGGVGLLITPAYRIGPDLGFSAGPDGFVSNASTIDDTKGLTVGFGIDLGPAAFNASFSPTSLQPPNSCPAPRPRTNDDPVLSIGGSRWGFGYGLGFYHYAGYGFLIRFTKGW
jgi:hypothetical protein